MAAPKERVIVARIEAGMHHNLAALVRSKQWNTYRGVFTNQVEAALGTIAGAPALATSSGTASLELSLRALGIGAGDDVIVPSSTFVATVQAVLLVGARPVLCNVSEATYNLTAAHIDRVRTPGTAAVVFVHSFGNPTGADEVSEYCRDHGLRLVEDAAQAIGARIGDTPVGSIGDCAAFSFNTSKPVSCGDGGAFTAVDPEVLATAKAIRHAGLRQVPDGRFLAFEVGGKSLMTEWQAAVLAPQLEVFNELQALRAGRALAIREQLLGLAPAARPHHIAGNTTSAWQRVAITTTSQEQAEKLLRGNDWVERFYTVPLVDEPIVASTAVIGAAVAQRCRDLWQRVVGVTLWPFGSSADSP